MLNKILGTIKKIMPLKAQKKIMPVYHYFLAKISAFLYKYPSEKMIVIGVTGTSGKSSACYFIGQILTQAGYKVGVLSTTIFKIGEREWLNDKKITMLGRSQTQKFLHQMLKVGCQVAIIETTSQGIEQFRHIGINYDILLFTNLYPEHIEAHGGFENYKKAKGKLFAYLKTLKHKNIKTLKQNFIKKTIIVNGDDDYAEYFLSFPAEEKIVYTRNKEIEKLKAPLSSRHGGVVVETTRNKGINKIILAENIKKENGITSTIIHNTLYIIHLLGDYNLYNVLAGVAVAETLNINTEIIQKAVANLKPLPGRLEFIHNNKNIKIIVDYAFEPKAMEKLYETIKEVPHHKIIHVLGSAGGGRDRARRPILGRLAAENADTVIITNEDPYEEEPKDIIGEVFSGAMTKNFQFPISNFQTIFKLQIPNSNKIIYAILDRREAIAMALKLAESNDLILITGKGAEQAMCIKNGKKIPWDDRQVVREELEKMNEE